MYQLVNNRSGGCSVGNVCLTMPLFDIGWSILFFQKIFQKVLQHFKGVKIHVNHHHKNTYDYPTWVTDIILSLSENALFLKNNEKVLSKVCSLEIIVSIKQLLCIKDLWLFFSELFIPFPFFQKVQLLRLQRSDLR